VIGSPPARLLAGLASVLLAAVACTPAAPATSTAAPPPTSAPPPGAPSASAVPKVAASPAASPSASASIAPSPVPAAAASTPFAGQREKLTVGYSAISANQLPAWIAADRGFFAENGLDVDLVSIAGGASPTAALLSGQIQALQISVEAMQATLGGGDLVYVAAPSNTVSFWLFSTPGITSGADLRGRRVGVTGIGTATYTAAKMAVRSLGLDPVNDVTYTSVNNVPAIVGALQTGAIDAGTVSMPTTIQARQAGLTELVEVAKLGIPFPSSWETFSRQYLNSHQDVARGRAAHIQRQAALGAVHAAEGRTVATLAPVAERVALRPLLDLDDLGPEVGQQRGGVRPGHVAGQFQDADAVEWARHRYRLSMKPLLCRSSTKLASTKVAGSAVFAAGKVSDRSSSAFLTASVDGAGSLSRYGATAS